MEKKEQKRHQHKHSGPKAQRKNRKKEGGAEHEQDERRRNPRAFSVQSAVRMAKTFHRSVLRQLHLTLPIIHSFSYVHLTQEALCLSLLSCASTLSFYNAPLSGELGVISLFLKCNLILFCRTQDIKTKKHHIPLVDRTPLEPPPVVVVVMGPPKVGKSTLIRCLIKNYTRQKLSDICGPVTIVSG